MKDKIWCMVKRPGEDARREAISNTLEGLQAAVDGFIEIVPVGADYRDPQRRVVMIVNEEGKLLGLAPNFILAGDIIVGTAVFASEGPDGELTDLPRWWRFTL